MFEYNNEIEILNKTLVEKETEIETITDEIQDLSNTKMQKFGTLLKSQHNLPESYSEMYLQYFNMNSLKYHQAMKNKIWMNWKEKTN